MNLAIKTKGFWLAALAVLSLTSAASAATAVYKCTSNDARPSTAPNNVLNVSDTSFPASCATPVGLGCWTNDQGSNDFNHPASISWSAAEAKTCASVRSIRVYAYNTLATAYPAGRTFAGATAKVRALNGSGGVVVEATDQSPGSGWSGLTTVPATGIAKIDTIAWYEYN